MEELILKTFIAILMASCAAISLSLAVAVSYSVIMGVIHG